MTNVQKVFSGLPQQTLDQITAAATRTGRTNTDVINWCIDVIGDNQMSQGTGIYWMARQAIRPSFTEVPVPNVRRCKGQGTIIVNLLPQTNLALVRATQRLDLGQDAVIICAALLAQFYGRRDGRLVCGRCQGNRQANAAISIVAYLT